MLNSKDWTPVEKQTPDKDGEYLVTSHFEDLKENYSETWMQVIPWSNELSSFYVECIRFEEDGSQINYIEKLDNVLAWMSLPEIYTKSS